MDRQFINNHQNLIDACKGGDRSAQFEIYKLYYKSMYNTSLRIVNDTGEAEDVMQESFLQAFVRLGEHSVEGTFGKWLKRIVVNNSLNRLRGKKELIPIDETEMDIPEVVEENLEEEIMLRVKDVKAAIRKLPEDNRVVLSLFLLEGYDFEEICEILHITNSILRLRYLRGKEKVLRILRKSGINEIFQSY